MLHRLTRPLTAFAAIILLAGTAQAQDDARGISLTLRPIVGAYLPTGDLQNQLKAAVLLGGQVAWNFEPKYSLVGSFAWSPSKDKLTNIPGTILYTGREETVDIYEYDLGVERHFPLSPSGAWSPYVALGGGGRSYHSYAGTESSWSGYGSVGTDFRPTAGPLGVRIEVRDNVSSFKGLPGDPLPRVTRNDVQITTGLSWRI